MSTGVFTAVDAIGVRMGWRLRLFDNESVGGQPMGYRVVVDFDLCESNARCMEAAPEVFEVRDDDFLYVLDETPPDVLRPKVDEAVRRCPKAAISVADD
jgi:ferredoxin